VLENYPRDELFQIDEDTLYHFALDIMNLSERPRVRALARPDEFDRFVSVLVFIPKDRYDTQCAAASASSWPASTRAASRRPIRIIRKGRSPARTTSSAATRARRRRSTARPWSGHRGIVRTWGDALRDQLADLHRRRAGARARDPLRHAFSAAYREAFGAEQAIADIAILEQLSEARPRAVDLYRREGDPRPA
jgi:glutamate dehydrogenase